MFFNFFNFALFCFSGTRLGSTFIPVGYWPSVSKWRLSTQAMRLLSGGFANSWPREALVSLFFFFFLYSQSQWVYVYVQINVFLGLAAVLWRMDRKRVTVGVDGSMLKFHPKMRDRMEVILDQLKPGDVNVSRVTPLAIKWITLDSNFALFNIFSSNWCYRRMAVVKGRLLLLLLLLLLKLQ